MEPADFRAIGPEKAEAAINTINAVLKEKKVPSKVRQKLNYAKGTGQRTLKSTDSRKKFFKIETHSPKLIPMPLLCA